MTSPSRPTYPSSTLYPSATGTGSSGGGTPGGSGAPVATTWSSPGGELSIGFNYTTTPPRAEIAINWSGATTVTLKRQEPAELLPVRYAEPATLDSSGKWAGFDYEVPYGVSVTYTITSAQKTAPVSVVTGVFAVPRKWETALIHPQAPSLSMPIQLAAGSGTTVKRAARQASLVVLGRKRPVVVSDVRESSSSQLLVWCDTAAERAGLDAILADGSALRLACDARLGLDVPSSYIAVGDQEVNRPDAAFGSLQARLVTLPYVEVDRPSGAFRGTPGNTGGTGSGFWTYDTAKAAYSTYAAGQAAFATYADAALDRVR